MTQDSTLPGRAIELVYQETEADHLVYLERREKRPYRSAQLIVVPNEWQPVPDVPRTRADCPRQRPCPHVHCRHHLWLVVSEERRGRPHEGKKAPSTLRPYSEESCALDVAEREHSASEVGRLLGVSKRRVQQILKRALAKLREAGARVEELKP